MPIETVLGLVATTSREVKAVYAFSREKWAARVEKNQDNNRLQVDSKDRRTTSGGKKVLALEKLPYFDGAMPK